MKIGIAFTAFRRPHYFKEAINSWSNVRGVSELLDKPTIYLEPSDKQDEMEAIAGQIGRVSLNKTKQGVLVNPWNALDMMFSPTVAGDNYHSPCDFVVLAEDDIVVSEDILEYFQWAAEEFETAKNVIGVCAFSRRGGLASDVTLNSRFSPLIWGTWADRWKSLLKDSWDKDYSTGNPDGSEAGWDWQFNRITERENMKWATPAKSRSDHIGINEGTHMIPEWAEGARGTEFEFAVPVTSYGVI